MCAPRTSEARLLKHSYPKTLCQQHRSHYAATSALEEQWGAGSVEPHNKTASCTAFALRNVCNYRRRVEKQRKSQLHLLLLFVTILSMEAHL